MSKIMTKCPCCGKVIYPEINHEEVIPPVANPEYDEIVHEYKVSPEDGEKIRAKVRAWESPNENITWTGGDQGGYFDFYGY